MEAMVREWFCLFVCLFFWKFCVGGLFQERHGTERPGWFSPDGTAAVPPYDWYGAYGHQANADQTYVQRLREDYTFDFPKNHAVVSPSLVDCLLTGSVSGFYYVLFCFCFCFCFFVETCSDRVDQIGAECEAARTRAALFDMSYFGNFYLTGADAAAAADWIFSNDVRRDAGHVSYTCMLNRNAGVESDLTVSILEGVLLFLCFLLRKSNVFLRCDGAGSEAAPWEPQFEGRGFYIAAGGGSAHQAWSHLSNAIEDAGFRHVQLVDRSRQVYF